MAENIPDVSRGLFPDGILGVKGWRRNQALIEQYASEILGDEQAQSTLANLGQLGAVENIIEQARRASTRDEQRPYISALAELTDSIGLFEREQGLAELQNRRLIESIAEASGFVDVTDREGLAQLADGLLRAQERARFDPAAAAEEMAGIESELRSMVNSAATRLNSQFVEPLRAHEFDVSGVEQQIRDQAGEDRWDEIMHPALTTQVLETAGATLQGSQEGRWSFAFQGLGYTPDQVPEMTYQQGLAMLTSSLRGKQQFVADELERRGAPAVGAVRERLDAEPMRGPARASGVVEGITDTVSNLFSSDDERARTPALTVPNVNLENLEAAGAPDTRTPRQVLQESDSVIGSVLRWAEQRREARRRRMNQ